MNIFKRYEKDEKYVVDSFGLYEMHRSWEDTQKNYRKHSVENKNTKNIVNIKNR